MKIRERVVYLLAYHRCFDELGLVWEGVAGVRGRQGLVVFVAVGDEIVEEVVYGSHWLVVVMVGRVGD